MIEGTVIITPNLEEEHNNLYALMKKMNLVIKDKETFMVGSIFRPSGDLQELVERYGSKLIQKAEKHRKKIGATFAICHPSLNYNYLEGYVDYFYKED